MSIQKDAQHYVIRGLKIKSTVKSHYIPIRMAGFQKLTLPNADRDVEHQEFSLLVRMQKWYSRLKRQFGSFLQS